MKLQEKSRLLLIDNFDSFTYNIADYFSQLGMNLHVLPQANCTNSDISQSDAVVLSPGPGSPVNNPRLMQLTAFAAASKPVLGICLGHQALALHFGASVEKGNPVHGKISTVHQVSAESPWLSRLPERFQVVRYHSLHVTALPEEVLMPELKTEDNILMAFRHKSKPVAGIQFHPEAHLTEFGLQILGNWLDFCLG